MSTNSSLLSDATLYSTLTNITDFRAMVWNQQVIQTQRLKSKWRHFAGGEASGMPITKKTDLEAGMAQDVVFTTLAPMLGQGVLGETILRTATQGLNFNTFKVRVDVLRQAFAYTQLLPLMRLKNQTIDQVGANLTSDWWNNKYDDDISITLREYARLTAPGQNLYRVGGGASTDVLTSSNVVSPTVIEASKAFLQSNGATPISEDASQVGGAPVFQYLLKTTDSFMRPMRTNATYLASLQYADVRGKDNALYTGKYPLWDNNIIYPEVVQTNDGDGRQGTPLLPIAYLGTALADATSVTTVTGGGTAYPAGTGDYFAYFPGYAWSVYTGQSLASDTGTYYAMIYNVSGAATGSYEIVSYEASGVHSTGKQITVTRVGLGLDGNQRANAAGRFTAGHPSGSVIVPCTSKGVPYGWALHMGAEALFYATGAIDAQPIFQGDDFHDSAGKYMFEGRGIMGIRGMAPFVDKRGIAKNFTMVEAAINPHPLVSPVAYP